MQEHPRHQKQIFFMPVQNHPKWNSDIVPYLQNMQNKRYSSQDIIDVLQTFHMKYCWRRKEFGEQKGRRRNNYEALYDLYGETLPALFKLFSTALLLIKPEPILMVMGQSKGKYAYKKQQLVYLLLLMFFSLVPKQYSDNREYLQGKFHNLNNFNHILSNSEFKTQCIVEYLKISVTELLIEKKNKEVFTIFRNIQQDRIQDLILKQEGKKMGRLVLEENDRSIEEFNGEIKVDFANRFIGGGCLRNGCVQEEIMFAVRPELYATTLLCQKMEDNEALAFIGFKRYFDYSGYGNTTSYVGTANIEYQQIEGNQARELITAIDAIKFQVGGKDQFQRKMIDREILKAYVGFSTLPYDGRIITGGWGCGVYHGDIQTKLLIQWIAATLANRQLIFCPFGKKGMLEEENLVENLRKMPVGFVYKLLLQASKAKFQPKYLRRSLFSFANYLLNKL